MKKTLVLTHEYYPFRGGVARYCHNLFKFFNNSEYLVITDNKKVETKDNVINIKLTYSWFKPSWLLSYFKLKKIIKKHNIEQIFTPNILPLGSLAYYLKIPYVISLHGLDINLALKNKPGLARKILENAKAIIVNTKNTAEIIKPLKLDNSKIHLIYPGLDFDTNYDESKLEAFRKKLEIGDNKIIMTLARLNKRKGQDLVIEAVAQIKNDYKLKYFIVGSGEEKKHLEFLIAKHKLSDNVFIFDNIDDEELIYFFKLADIFAMPHKQLGSDVEGFGMVFLEAASCRLPIIAGDSGGVKEVFNRSEQAILVPSDDLRALVVSIKHLLNNPQEADKLADAAYKRAGQFKGAQQQSLILKGILK
ncbi:MAG: glycosyltransferase family 4 protein [Candidatus Komeilibacteria bacterium]|jgi:phosphatidyl-myo-inositol dimannoside synthase|nr:glycosyltransferase family 4 protein [Candidatus Komeilibacteria bacterium]